MSKNSPKSLYNHFMDWRNTMVKRGFIKINKKKNLKPLQPIK